VTPHCLPRLPSGGDDGLGECRHGGGWCRSQPNGRRHVGGSTRVLHQHPVGCRQGPSRPVEARMAATVMGTITPTGLGVPPSPARRSTHQWVRTGLGVMMAVGQRLQRSLRRHQSGCVGGCSLSSGPPDGPQSVGPSPAPGVLALFAPPRLSTVFNAAPPPPLPETPTRAPHSTAPPECRRTQPRTSATSASTPRPVSTVRRGAPASGSAAVKPPY